MSPRAAALILIATGAVWFGWWGREYRASRTVTAAKTTAVVDSTPAAQSASTQAGSRLYENGLLPEAAAEFRRVIAAEPENARAWFLLGVVQERMGDLEGAVESYLAGARVAPDKAALHTAAGIAYARLGRYGESVASLDRALALRPDDGRSLFSRALSRSRMGDSTAAEQDMEAACSAGYQDACRAVAR